METQFDTEAEAEEALKVARLTTLGWCPVIKELCKNNCICYYEGGIRKDPFKTKWNVHYPSCQHGLITGEITARVEY